MVPLQTNSGVVYADEPPMGEDAPVTTSPDHSAERAPPQILCGPGVGEKLESRRDLIGDLLICF